jgi:Mg-chelatase subunit ChlD
MRDLLFSRPGVLWGLFASSLPLIIHLINRHRARRHPFAALDFLFRVQRRSARRILLRHILLLAARTLLIAALVVAAAGPMLRARRSTAIKGPTTTALVIDQSLSMRSGYRDRIAFDVAIESARKHVRGMAPGDKACLLAAGHVCKILVEPCTDSRGTLLDAIDNLHVQYGKSDLTEALEKAAVVLARTRDGTKSNFRILLLTDGALHAFGSAPRFPPDSPAPEVVLENVSAGLERDNIALADIDQRSNARYLEVNLRISSFSSGDQKNLPVEIRLERQVLSRGFTDLPAGETRRKSFNIQCPEKTELLIARLSRDDALAEDNQTLLYVSGQRTVRALLVNGDMRPILHQDELFYLEHALSPAGEGASGIRFTTITPDRFTKESLDNVEVVFLANVHGLSPESASALRSFVAAGGGLFVAMGNRVEVDRTNQILDDLLPWPLRDKVATGPVEPEGEHKLGTHFTDIDQKHPAFALFEESQIAGLKAVRIWRAVVLEPGQAGRRTTVLMNYANGAPALVESPYRNGRVMLFTSTLDRDWNSWPARASFLPFLQRTTAYLAGRLGQMPPVEVEVGTPVRISLVPDADSVRLISPDGTPIDVAPSEAAGSIGRGESAGESAASAVFRDTWTPGWYKIVQMRKGQTLPKESTPGLIVTIPLQESNLEPIGETRLQELLGQGIELTLAGDADGSSQPRSLLFLLLALGLVLVEAFLIRK